MLKTISVFSSKWINTHCPSCREKLAWHVEHYHSSLVVGYDKAGAPYKLSIVRTKCGYEMAVYEKMSLSGLIESATISRPKMHRQIN